MFRNDFVEDRFVAAVEKIADAYAASVRQQAERQATPPTLFNHTYDDVKQLVEAGQIINAITMFRKMTRAGLKDSKDVVDMLRGLSLRQDS